MDNKKTSRIAYGVILAAAVVVYCVDYYSEQDYEPKTSETKTIKLTPDQIKEFKNLLTVMEQDGLLYKFEPHQNELYVDPEKWNAMLYEDKKFLAMALAKYCCYLKKDHEDDWLLNINDKFSGKTIARFGRTGLEVY